MVECIFFCGETDILTGSKRVRLLNGFLLHGNENLVVRYNRRLIENQDASIVVRHNPRNLTIEAHLFVGEVLLLVDVIFQVTKLCLGLAKRVQQEHR